MSLLWPLKELVYFALMRREAVKGKLLCKGYACLNPQRTTDIYSRTRALIMLLDNNL